VSAPLAQSGPTAAGTKERLATAEIRESLFNTGWTSYVSKYVNLFNTGWTSYVCERAARAERADGRRHEGEVGDSGERALLYVP